MPRQALCIIGAGPAGYAAAMRAHDLKKDVTIIERDRVGGVGIHSGALSSKTMEARDVPGLFFVGEVMDVTGHLGGYNFQWAWSSGYAAGQAV